MTAHDYDTASPESIREYAEKLIGKSLEETVGIYNLDQLPNKGRLGSLVEDYFYKYRPTGAAEHLPDFSEAGVELKVTGVIPRKTVQDGEVPFKAKERLVLSMIHYVKLANETWEQNTLMKKCSLMLLLFYLYQKELPAPERKFVHKPVLWEFPDEDIVIIKRDWLAIQQKIFDGKAHELSEGDTFYLGACRKGSGGPKETLKIQPFSTTLAKARAFSLKPSYVDTILNKTWNQASLIRDEHQAEEGIEAITTHKFSDLEGKSIAELADLYAFPIGEKLSKSYFSQLSLRILGTKKKHLPEFVKAGVTMKTIRLNHSGTPSEAMSFPNFNFIELSEQKWEDSAFYEQINQKFFFVIYQYDEAGTLRFKKVMFWNMPYADRLEAQQVWEKTVKAINECNPDQFPKSSQSHVAHVRPHGANKADTLPLPCGKEFTRQCFWLNRLYIADQVK